MYCGVPSEMPVCVTRAPPAFETANAIPKSAMTGWPAYLHGRESAGSNFHQSISTVRLTGRGRTTEPTNA
jgi:hypothetical protein